MQMYRKRTIPHEALHKDGSCVLHVYLKIAPMSSKGVNRPRNTKERIKIIKLVDLRKHATTTQVGPCRVALPIILVGMPVGQVFPRDSANGYQIAETATLDDLSQL